MIPLSILNTNNNGGKVCFNYGGLTAYQSPRELMAKNHMISMPVASTILESGFPSSSFVANTFYLRRMKSRMVFLPNVVQKMIQVSPRYSFIPLRQNSISGLDEASKCATSFVDNHSISSTDLKKLSPTPSVRTLTTLESFESFRGSVDAEEEALSPLPYIPITGSRSHLVRTNHELSTLQHEFLNPPPSISFCQAIQSNIQSSRFNVDYSPVPSSNSSTKRKSLLFPRNEQDPNRKCRIKTELCLHYINNSYCPFGTGCTYAHGKEELQLKNLLDLHYAGLIDISTYRTVPCLTYVSTGSCPFGKRCSGIHDPRVSGTEQSWLPHTETQGNTITTDINVDALHQKRLYSILRNNPFGSLFTSRENSFNDLYDLTCNRNKSSLCGMKNKFKKKLIVPQLQEQHKLSIALKMRGGSNFQFKFRPQHIIYDTICMVLQKRAFRLNRDEAAEIPISMFRPKNDILVQEIAFGPDCEPTVRGVGLWFAIDESDVTVCTPQQAKRYRWKRSLHKKNCDVNGSKNVYDRSGNVSKFDLQDSFTMVRPSEHDAYGLSTAILDHRLAVIKMDRIVDTTLNNIEHERLKQERFNLEERFQGMIRAWTNWSWPGNRGREEVDENTPVPPVDGCYEVNRGRMKSIPVADIWENFASNSFDSNNTNSEQENNEEQEFKLPTNADLDSDVSRLHVFKRLAAGVSIPCQKSSCFKMPHIRHNNDTFKTTISRVIQSRRCWNALLLKPTSTNECNEWEIVRQHFLNSRSRKVLSILQQ